ncbi:MAG TPA: DinB family protein [Chitinophagaceae bacterium]
MKLIEAIAEHFYQVNYGDNWTDVAVRDVLANISYEQSVKKTGNANTIAMLLHHMDFYNRVVYDRLLEGSKQFKHEDSLEVNIQSEADWQALQKRYFEMVDLIHQTILGLDESRLFEKKTANTLYKNLHGLVEHIHYHLGQIVILKKLG